MTTIQIVEVTNQKGDFVGTEIKVGQKVYMIDAAGVNTDYSIRHNGFIPNIDEDFTYTIVSEVILKQS